LLPAERRLLLGLILDPSRLTHDEISDPAIAWTELGIVAAHHRVTPLVYRGLRALEGVVALPAAARRLRDLGRAAYVRNVARNTRMLAEAARVLVPLQGAGIPVILLKGAAVAGTLFGDIGLRAMGDVDLLVPVEDRARARALLESLGYRVDPGVPAHLHAQARRAGLVAAREAVLSPERTAELYERYHFHYYLVRDGQPFPLELHWDIATADRGVQIEEWWAQARPLRIGALGALCFGPEHTLLHFALHLAMDGYAHVRLARLMDLHLAVTRQALDVAALRRAAERHRATRALGVALHLTHVVLGTPVPEPLRGLLDDVDRAIAVRVSRRWIAALATPPAAREPLDQTIAWTVLRRDRWRSVPEQLYRRFASYPECNPRLPRRYRGSELMNLLYAFHPVRLAPFAARGRGGEATHA
jgi:hypothetical protein